MAIKRNVLERTLKTAKNLARAMPITKTYATIIQEAVNLLDGINGSIYLDLDGELKRVYTTVPIKYRVESRKGGNLFRAFSEKTITLVSKEEFLRVHPVYGIRGATHYINIPLIYDNKSIGVITLQVRKIGDFNQDDMDLMWNFGYLASLRIRNAILYEQLSGSLKTRDIFISLAVHELGTPLTTLGGYLNLLSKKGDLKHGESILTQLSRLQKTLDKLKEFNQLRGDTKVSVRRRFNVRKALDRAVINFRAHFQSYQVVIEDNLEHDKNYIKGDIYKITQVFYNIFENAAKFSKDIDPIFVQLRTNAQNVVIKIIDRGIGIQKKDIKKVLAGHFKSGHTNEGMATGLYLSKVIVESHGGVISLISRVNKGTQVVIKLPLS